MASNAYRLRRKSSISYTQFFDTSSNGPDELEDSDDSVYDASSEDDEPYRKQKKVLKRCKVEKKEEVSEYEKLREKNLAEKAALLQSLDIFQTIEDLKKQKPQKRERVVQEDEVKLPSRKSVRIQELALQTANATPDCNEPSASATRQRRHPSKPLGLLDVSYDDNPVPEDFITRIENLQEEKIESNSLLLMQYERYFPSMKMASHLSVKVLPGKLRSLAIHPSQSTLLCCAGGRDGCIGLWSANSQGCDGVPCTFSPHVSLVYDVKFHKDNHHHLFSCSADGTIRRFDLSRLVFEEIYATIDEDIECRYMDFLDSNTLIVGHSNGTLAVIDTRTSQNNPEQVYEIADFPVKTVSVHPTQKEMVLVSASWCTADVYDMRRLARKPSAVATLSDAKCFSSAFFSPCTGKFILAISSSDSVVRVVNSTNLCGHLHTKTAIRYSHNSGKNATLYSASWLPNIEEAFVVSSVEYPRQIKVSDVRGCILYVFSDKLMTSATYVNAFHPTLPVLVGGNEAGKLFIFIAQKK